MGTGWGEQANDEFFANVISNELHPENVKQGSSEGGVRSRRLEIERRSVPQLVFTGGREK